MLNFCIIPEYDLIKLLPFDKSDYPRLIAEIPDARFLLQWAGPRYTFPLDNVQLNDTLARSRGEKPSYLVFKAVTSGSQDTVGHVQLMNIDYEIRSSSLGRILIFRKHRGSGFGHEMVKKVLRIAFSELDLNELTLGVFDFNDAAIRIYRKSGFSELQRIEEAREFEGASWNLIRMKLSREDWLKNEHRDHRPF